MATWPCAARLVRCRAPAYSPSQNRRRRWAASTCTSHGCHHARLGVSDFFGTHAAAYLIRMAGGGCRRVFGSVGVRVEKWLPPAAFGMWLPAPASCISAPTGSRAAPTAFHSHILASCIVVAAMAALSPALPTPPDTSVALMRDRFDDFSCAGAGLTMKSSLRCNQP